jgi:thioesterase domain-containing protein/acyl carrier protein
MLAADLAVVRRLAPATCVARIGYGLSELKYGAAFYADAQTVLPGTAMPGGFPVEYVTVEIHDDDGNALPAGEMGEIVLYSDYLSPGYWRRPEITAAKYGVDGAGRRFYRSGDLGYLDDEGCLWMLGRRDGQLKILGQRVETSEVEAVIAALPGVREALVVARTRPDDEKELVAYIVQTADSLWTAATVRRRLAELLPTYMVPVAVGFLDQLPRNTNHKPDRSRLPAIATPEIQAVDLPISPRETEVAALVGELLGQRLVGRDQNILDLGAHSLLAARLAMRIRRRFGVDLPVRMILAGTTVAEIARYLDRAEAGSAPPVPLSLVVQPGKPDHTPLFLCLGGGGSETELMWYAALLRRLDPDQPIVALLGRGTGGAESAHESVEAMVADYLAAIRSRQPQGPYLLGGECIGAKLAFLLAQRLEAGGESVANLLLLDATHPAPHQLQGARARRQQWQRRALYHWDYVHRLGLAEGASYLWHRLATRLPGSRWGDPGVRRSLIARARYRRLLGELAVTGRVQAPVVMITSDESRRAGVPAAWRSLLVGDVVEETVPGNHRSYLGAYVHITGDAVRRQLVPILLPRQAAWSVRP